MAIRVFPNDGTREQPTKRCFEGVREQVFPMPKGVSKDMRARLAQV